jgi:hypothetical protein
VKTETAQHTPGPWTLQPIGDETECNILGAGRELVATVSDNDARLIAAAPEMYALLKAQTPDYPLSDCAANQRHIAAQKIIASIEGR